MKADTRGVRMAVTMVGMKVAVKVAKMAAMAD
jgi:hypothetical protein